MAKLKLEDINAKADEYAKLVGKIERAEKVREGKLAPIVERHAEEIEGAVGSDDRKIGKLRTEADALRAEVVAWMGPKKKTYAAESELATFGVDVGQKPGSRLVNAIQLMKLCKKKGVDIWLMLNIVLGEADKLLGKKEVDAISTKDMIPTRDEYLRVKAQSGGVASKAL